MIRSGQLVSKPLVRLNLKIISLQLVKKGCEFPVGVVISLSPKDRTSCAQHVNNSKVLRSMAGGDKSCCENHDLWTHLILAFFMCLVDWWLVSIFFEVGTGSVWLA